MTAHLRLVALLAAALVACRPAGARPSRILVVVRSEQAANYRSPGRTLVIGTSAHVR